MTADARSRWTGLLAGFVLGAGAATLFWVLFAGGAPEKPAGPGSERAIPEASDPTEQPHASTGPQEAPCSEPATPGGAAATATSDPAGPVLVRGRVLFGPRRIPMAYVPIVVSKDGEEVHECLSDQDGFFFFRAPAGSAFRAQGKWTVRVSVEPGIRFDETADAREGFRPPLEFLVAVPERLTFDVLGTVKDESGTPIADVNVTLKDFAGDSGRRQTKTDAAGAYLFPGLPYVLEYSAGSALEGMGDPVLEHGIPVTLHFEHPHYTSHYRDGCARPEENRNLRIDAQLMKIGVIRGRLTGAPPESLEGVWLPYVVHGQGEPMAMRVLIDQGRFFIRALAPARIVIGGIVKRWRARGTDVGNVDRETFIDGMEVVLDPLPLHRILLLGRNGQPLPDAQGVYAWMAIEGPHSEYLEIEDGRIVVPLFFSGSRDLTVGGWGVLDKTVKISDRELPPSIEIDLLPPMIIGEIRFPEGFTEWEKARITVETRAPGGTERRLWLSLKDPWGRFTVRQIARDYHRYTFHVRVSIPGHPEWSQFNISLEEGGEPLRLKVTFDK